MLLLYVLGVLHVCDSFDYGHVFGTIGIRVICDVESSQWLESSPGMILFVTSRQVRS